MQLQLMQARTALNNAMLRSFRYLKVGMPVTNPLSLYTAISIKSPADATCLERTRDRVLLAFCGATIAKVFIALSLVVLLLVLIFGLVIIWAALGLYLRVQNGWHTMTPTCLAAAAALNQTLLPYEFPTPYGSISHCSGNQQLFNISVKVFTCLFSYINFLPIPWRLAIFHHSWLSRRPSTPGLDFYGRPTETMWFNLPRSSRRSISALLNLACISHFVSQVSHLVYWTYVQGQTLPGSAAQNVPFAASIVAVVVAGVIQERSENALIAAHPELYPPRLGHYLRRAWRKWQCGGFRSSLLSILREEWRATEGWFGVVLTAAEARKLARDGTFRMLATLRGFDKEALEGLSDKDRELRQQEERQQQARQREQHLADEVSNRLSRALVGPGGKLDSLRSIRESHRARTSESQRSRGDSNASERRWVGIELTASPVVPDAVCSRSARHGASPTQLANGADRVCAGAATSLSRSGAACPSSGAANPTGRCRPDPIAGPPRVVTNNPARRTRPPPETRFYL